MERSFTIQTDHRSLEWLDRIKDTNARLTRWSLFLQGYSYRTGAMPMRSQEFSKGIKRYLMPDKGGGMWRAAGHHSCMCIVLRLESGLTEAPRLESSRVSVTPKSWCMAPLPLDYNIVSCVSIIRRSHYHMFQREVTHTWSLRRLSTLDSESDWSV